MSIIIGMLILFLGACLFIKSLKCMFRVVIGIVMLGLIIYFITSVLPFLFL